MPACVLRRSASCVSGFVTLAALAAGCGDDAREPLRDATSMRARPTRAPARAAPRAL
jgi:hypothetical protein